MSSGGNKSAAGPVRWDEAALRAFFKAFHTPLADGAPPETKWAALSVSHDKTPEHCEALAARHAELLGSLGSLAVFETAFVGAVLFSENKGAPGAKEEPGSQSVRRPAIHIFARSRRGPGPAGDAQASARPPRCRARKRAHLITGGSPARGRRPPARTQRPPTPPPTALQEQADGAAHDNGKEDSAAALNGDADGEDGAPGPHPAAGGRPVRSTRGKPPSKVLSPLPEEPAAGGRQRAGSALGTPGKGAKGMLASPSSSKLNRLTKVRCAARGHTHTRALLTRDAQGTGRSAQCLLVLRARKHGNACPRCAAVCAAAGRRVGQQEARPAAVRRGGRRRQRRRGRRRAAGGRTAPVEG